MLDAGRPALLVSALLLAACQGPGTSLSSASPEAATPESAGPVAPSPVPQSLAGPVGPEMTLAGSSPGARDDLTAYQRLRDYASIELGTYASSHQYPDDNFQRVEFGLHQGHNTWVLGLNRAQRFGLIDEGVDLYWYRSLGQGYWGYLYGAYNPNSQFLARTILGADLDRQVGAIDWSFAYTRMLFTQDSVDLYVPGATYYFNDQWSLALHLYDVPVSGARSVSIMPVYQDARHDRYYVALSVGDVADRAGALSDFQKHSGGSIALGGEHRLAPRWSVGADALFEHRSGLYDRHGVDVYLKTWW